MDVFYSMTPNLYADFEHTVRSVKEYNKGANIHVFVEDEGIEGFDCIRVNPRDYFTLPNYRLSLMCFARVLAPLLLDCDRALYLDVDTICCENLQPLFDLDMTGKYFAMVPEVKGRWNPYNREHYYNAGVTLMNLAEMRKDNVTEQLIQGMNTGRYVFGEQDAINDLFYDKIITLPPRYNDGLITAVTDAPAIIHYAAIVNWKTANVPHAEMRDKYLGPPMR